jgi:hypothetical protein
MRRVSVVFLISILTVLAFSQQSDVSEDDKRTLSKLLDVPSETYRFTASHGWVEFCNLTRVKVKGFRPGCVERKGDELLIVEERDFKEAKIQAATKNLQAYSRKSWRFSVWRRMRAGQTCNY